MNKIIHDYFHTEKQSRNVKTVIFKKNEIILRPYDDTNNIYAISEGLIKLYNIDSRGKEYMAVIYGPGDFYPLAWLINQDRPSLYFQAITDCEIQIIPRIIFQEQLNKNIQLSNIFMQQVLEQFAYYASTVNNLGLKLGRERLYYKLLIIASRYGNNKKGVVTIPPISHSDLAITIRLTRETVSREISRLEKLNIIKYSRKNIIIKDIAYLQKGLGQSVSVTFFDYI